MRHAPRPRALVNLAFCKLLTDASIGALAGNCPLLESVNLHGCELLTDVSIVAFAGSCPMLESVSLAGNFSFVPKFTDVSIGALAGSCPLLKSVNLEGCELITDASLAALKAALPDANIEGPGDASAW